MLSNELKVVLMNIISDQYDLSGETQARVSLKKAGLNPDREMRRSTAKHRELKKMMKYDALQKSKGRQKELRKQKAIASIGT
jgi:hypothetical protein